MIVFLDYAMLVNILTSKKTNLFIPMSSEKKQKENATKTMRKTTMTKKNTIKTAKNTK